MTSAHSSLRELVAHLGRAQRAFDAGALDEAEGAIAAALAIDPHNVQAADLRQRIAKIRPPAASSAGRVPGRRRVAPVAGVETVPAGRVSAAAWSTFEQRVRARRADRAVADAQEALARGDLDAAEAALTELGEVAPDDPRHGWLAASLEASAPEPSVFATSRADQPIAARQDDLSLRLMDPVAAWPIEIRPQLAAPMPHRRPGLRRAIVGLGAIAASGLLGFWLFTGRPADSVAGAPPAHEHEAVQPEAAAPAPTAAADPTPLGTGGEETVGPGLDVPPTVGSDAPTVSETASDATTVGAAGSDAARAGSGGQTAPIDAEVSRQATAPALATPRPALDTALPAPAARSAPETARSEPAPMPLDAPVQSPINPPEMRRGGDPRGNEAAARPIAPLPAPPPAAAVATPAGAPVSRAANEVSAVRAVIDGYAEAFTALDASATQRVWPAVDQRALRRAFEQLSAQSIAFNRCEVNATGDTAEAVCVGRATWVPKVGDRSPKSEPRTWRFAMGRDQGEWVIDRVQVQR
jgi:hypothetical protein